SSFKRQWEQSQDGRQYGDHYGPNTLDTRVRKRLLQGFTFRMHFLDEIEEHDDVADDHADQAGDAQKSHKAKRRMHNREGDERADHTIGSSGEYQKRFDCIVELNEQRQVNPNQRNHQNDFQVTESVYLFCPFATNPELITRRETFLE